MALITAGRSGPLSWRARRRQRAAHPYDKLYRRVRWMAPTGTALCILMLPFYLDKAVAAVAGGLAVAWLAREPARALRWLICFLPFTIVAFSFLYKVGVPIQVVRPMAFWKEALLVAVVVAGVLKARTAGSKADVLDAFCLAYVALGTAYLVLPDVFVDGPGAEIAFGTRVQGFRTDVAYVLLFLGARHARMPGDQVLRCARAFAFVCGIIAAVGVFEFLASSTWNDFVVNTLGTARYRVDLLRVPFTDSSLYDVRTYTSVAGRQVLRVGSVLLGFQPAAFTMVVGTAILAELQLRRGTGRTGWVALALPLVAAGVVLTQTRSAVLALATVLGLVVLRLPGRQVMARVRMTLVVGGLALLALPIVFAIGLADRLGGKDDNSSNTAHANSTRNGFEVLLDTPLGNGLSTAAGAGQRNDATTAQISENQLLQIGTQIGLAGLVLWIGCYLGVLRRTGAVLRARHLARGGTRGPTSDPYAVADHHPAAAVVAATRVAFLAFVPAMMFLQTFIFFPVAWALWGLAGAALGSLEAGPAHADETDDAYGRRYGDAGAYA